MRKCLLLVYLSLFLPIYISAQDALCVHSKKDAGELQIAFRALGKIVYEENTLTITHRQGHSLYSSAYDDIQQIAFADHQPVFTQTYDTICSGETYTWNGNTYTRPGSYTDTLQNIYGYDSIVTLHLEVLPDPPITFTVNGVNFKMMRVRAGTFMMGATADDTEAEADEFPRHEVTLTKDYFIGETEMTQALWQAIMGDNPSQDKSNPQSPVNNVSWDDCQVMIAKLNELTGLTFRLPTEAEWEYAARAGHYSRGYIYAGSNDIDEVAWYNKPYYTSVASLKPNELGVYDMSGSVYEWCQDWYDPNAYQSPDHRIDPFQAESEYEQKCLRGGSNKSSQGIQTKKYSRLANRGQKESNTKASHVGLRLALEATGIMENNREFVTYDTICSGETITWNGNTYSKPGSYTDTLSNIHGCDSIVTLHLEVNPTYEVHDTIVACDSYTWHEDKYEVSGVYYDSLQSINGCDSVVVLHLTINKTIYAEETVTACDSYTWNGQTYTESGNYTYTTTAANGCDSVFILHLTINDSEVGTTEYVTICHGETYTWNGNTYTTSDTYTITLSNTHGCDSTATLVLTVLPEVITQTESVVIGSNELPYTWRGQSLQLTGQYTDTLYYAAAHCDSVIHVLDLLVLSTGATDSQDTTLCETSLPYLWYDQSLRESGTYTYTENYAGTSIDSIQHILHLTVNPTVYTQETAVSCDFYTWNGETYTESGEYTYTTTAANGCDSIVTLHLTIKASSPASDEYATICYGESHTWNGNTYTQPDSYTDTLQNIYGCDSIVTLHLTILPAAVSDTLSVVIGSDAIPYVWRAKEYLTTGQHIDVEQYVSTACDSAIHVLDLTVLTTGNIDEQSVTICESEAPYLWNGESYSSTDTYTYTEKYVGTNIDSIQHILHLVVNPTYENHDTITTCDSYTWSNGVTYTDSGIYVDSLHSVHGCDSVEVLDLTVLHSTTFTCDTTVCASYWFYGEELSSSGEYIHTMTNAQGCDSVIRLHLTVNPTTPVSYITDTVCSNDLPYVFNDSVCEAAGVYTFVYQNQYGCDSTVVLELHILEELLLSVDSLSDICADDKALVLHFDVLQGRYDSLQIRFLGDNLPAEFYPQTLYDRATTDVVYPLDSTIRAGEYAVRLEFYQGHFCGTQVFTLPFTIKYAASMIVQKWNVWLALKNVQYNGNYTFTAYQWYMNGEPLLGETSSTLHRYLDPNAFYSVLLTRDDGWVMSTCDFVILDHLGFPRFPTMVKAAQQLYVANTTYVAPIETINIYSTLGQHISTTQLVNGAGNVTMPMSPGNYIVKIHILNNQVISQLLIVL